jgi:biopolymer transport protein TolR
MDVRAGERNGVIAAINIVPLIDILLVLLIIFMVISPVSSLGLSARIPQPSASLAPRPGGTVVIRVLASDALQINQENVSWQELGSRLRAIFSQRAERVAFIDGGNAVEFEEVARAMDIMRAAGIDRIGLISGSLPAAR